MSKKSTKLFGRSRARAQALQLLFQSDILNQSVADLLAEDLYALEDGPLDEYARTLAAEVDVHKEWIDNVIDEVSVNWSVSRMPLVDKNILRIAVCELFFVEDMAVNIAINEAVELAKIYAGDDSTRFINGVLGKIARDKIEGSAEVEIDEADLAFADQKLKRPDFIAKELKEE